MATRLELYTRVHAAGRFEHVDETQLKTILDEAARELTLEELWDWRRTTQTGAAPLTVSFLGTTDTVIDPERRVLFPRRRSELIEAGYDLSTSGQGLYYYESGDVIDTYPVATSITVNHFSRKAWSVGGEASASDSDSPLAPAGWHDVVFQLALRKGMEHDRRHDEAAAVRAEYERRLEQLRHAFLAGYDEPDVIRCEEVY